MVQEIILEDMPYGELKKAFNHLEKKNKDLIDSLYYAAFVQQGLMPQARHFEKLGYPYFVYYNPLQIIGGDFFWNGKKGDWDLVAVGDCTGHLATARYSPIRSMAPAVSQYADSVAFWYYRYLGTPCYFAG